MRLKYHEAIIPPSVRRRPLSCSQLYSDAKVLASDHTSVTGAFWMDVWLVTGSSFLVSCERHHQSCFNGKLVIFTKTGPLCFGMCHLCHCLGNKFPDIELIYLPAIQAACMGQSMNGTLTGQSMKSLLCF